MESVPVNMTQIMGSVLIRCKKCRRPFATSADCCPDCGKLSPRGERSFGIKIASVVLTVAALTTALVLTINHLRSPSAKEATGTVGGALPPAQGSSGSEVSFATQ
jgi:hypothetical protein